MVRVPGVNHLDVVKALQKVGFHVARQSKHIVMTDGRHVVTIPRHNPVNAFYTGRDCARRRVERGAVP